MQNNEKRIVVVTPMFNYGKYFQEYFSGIVGQKLKPSKVVIVDDGSTDNSYELVCGFLAQKSKVQTDDNKAKIYHDVSGIDFAILQLASNQGPSVARNAAIQYSVEDADVYAMYDMDDVYFPEKISESIQAMKALPHVNLVYSDYITHNTKTGVRHREFKEPYNFNRLNRECIVSTNSLITANILKMVGLYDPQLRVAEDYDLYMRIAEKSVLYHLPKPLFEYRVSGEGATFSVPKEVWQQCWHRVQQKAAERRKK